MKIIKLNAIPSTNGYLKRLANQKPLEDFTTVVCESQTAGRGQAGNSWASESGKNLTFSFLKHHSDLKVEQQFQLNKVVSLAVLHTLNNLNIPNLCVKWPNDIMSGNLKVGGILIENVLKGNTIQKSIIGIGLNVNQTDFGELLKAGSLKGVMSFAYGLDDLLLNLLGQLKRYFSLLGKKHLDTLYLDHLFRKGLVSKFETKKGIHEGSIIGVDELGRLIVDIKNEIHYFNLREIKLIF